MHQFSLTKSHYHYWWTCRWLASYQKVLRGKAFLRVCFAAALCVRSSDKTLLLEKTPGRHQVEEGKENKTWTIIPSIIHCCYCGFILTSDQQMGIICFFMVHENPMKKLRRVFTTNHGCMSSIRTFQLCRQSCNKLWFSEPKSKRILKLEVVL